MLLKDLISSLSFNKVIGDINDIDVSGIGSLKAAKENEISFAAGHKYLKQLIDTKACAVIMDYESLKSELPSKVKFIILDSKNSYLSFAQATQIFKNFIDEKNKIDYNDIRKNFQNRYYIGATSKKGENTVIYPGVYIGEGSSIGDNCRIMSNVNIGNKVNIGNNVLIYPNVTIYDDSKIGNNCIIHAGAVIGSDGFGFARGKSGYVKIIHTGYAELEDNVEIGANTTIDRGAVDFTKIGAGTKIDNLVQVAHNVIIGKNCVIAAQTGIAGSTEIGDNVTIGGQVGIAGHIEVGNNVMIAAQSGISGNIKDGEILSGSPAFPIKEWRNSVVLFKKLPELYKKLKEISKTKD
ncbi:MAG: UDP-3-O-(3-hydroxymyristoyl)glucosamine N-acyltransferase [Candidatus Acidulodesulfobacterium acidiphilum]|uniref:UDP-3-O-acylglucosamine N-acyltransferase n=1 Tax=Candidatus Acidulodesulfobacterium acidiphilum TaxID=2597224 RepID=A0A520XEI1_9DELT|nr:MAG: UDP-3-O-(3-hydroxymyristoyl)glucosamine N-acyltransferase [Candidatus Acidulodesulfobacterium acidiphilum]